ncbi:hypothetical protein [Rhodococcoides fascians]|uniref:hypothetical protein n=1 Tax=Rhodococcoides fascians TaxID=1828 RepID=UPI00278787B1|nr:hypothetical protein [Rhodococcus fascians]MDP9639307.1 hypothetical protein [Rhodococcus cercidiphylli]MDQ0283606.1 hypothetical protein [Rhodococcus fascians]
MPAPNLFLIGVRETQAATAFYSDLFEIEPTFTSPHYMLLSTLPPVYCSRCGRATPSTLYRAHPA